MNAAYTLGRILIPLVFLVEGIQKADERRRHRQDARRQQRADPRQIVPYLGGIPKYEALGYLIAAIEIICGLMVWSG